MHVWAQSVPALPPGSPGPCRPSLPGMSVPIWEARQVSEDPRLLALCLKSTLGGAPQPLAQAEWPDPPGKSEREEA